MQYPDISPFLFQIGDIGIRWYSVMYIFGYTFAYLYYYYVLIPNKDFPVQRDKVMDILFYAFIGMLIGARTVYMLFYNFQGLVDDPISFLQIWNGGLSFHGGLLGVVVALLIFAKKNNIKFLMFGDRIILPIPMALFFGRIGNFFNGELYGRVVDPETFSMCMYFPNGGPVCRYPSQLFEALGEGIILFILLQAWYNSDMKNKHGSTVGFFLLMYGVIRFFIEFTREPDVQLGFIYSFLTMGQILSIPLVLIGLIMIISSVRVSRK